MEYIHLLITRFNLRIPFEKQKKLAEIDISTDNDYLNERFTIFEKYTIPSIVGQSCNNFKWIVLFDVLTPEVYKNRIEGYRATISNFVPVYLKDLTEERDIVNKFISDNSVNYIVTTRVDNDDAVSNLFIEKIQEYFKSRGMGYYAFGFQNGVQFDLKNKLASRYKFPLNHFTTMVSPVENEKNCIYSFKHTEINNKIDFTSIENQEPLWLEIVHGTNVSNRMHTKIRNIYNNPKELETFNCDITWNKRNYLRNVIYVFFLKPRNAISLIKGYGIKIFFKKLISKIRHGHG